MSVLMAITRGFRPGLEEVSRGPSGSSQMRTAASNNTQRTWALSNENISVEQSDFAIVQAVNQAHFGARYELSPWIPLG